LKGRSVFGVEIQEIGERAVSGHWHEGSGRPQEVDIREATPTAAAGFFGRARFASAPGIRQRRRGPILDMLVENLPGQHFTIFTEVDGTCPNHHPILQLKQILPIENVVTDKQLDFGIAFDGDADRIGAVDSEGR